MTVLEDIRKQRKQFLDGLKANQEDIKLDIFEDFYPDKAHFIYELLQNAEDTRASEVSFVLSENKLVFEHNGRPFDEEGKDIRAITGIGAGTKKNDDDKIGQFGIGFKSVFVYTETPRIWSPTFAFEILERMLPYELAPEPSLGEQTRFEFPFNSPKKPASSAFSEVRSGLEEISETTLLFLSHIKSIQWRVEGGLEGCLLRDSHSETHIETLKEIGGREPKSSHFLRFTQPVEGLGSRYVAVAFPLAPKESQLVEVLNANRPMAERFQIVPATPGCVAIFFVAKKETSGLRFHLHAPFAPELSRASIKDTLANEPLFQQLATLTTQSLFKIRDLGLLNTDFLAVLPNPKDELPERYECIREDIVNTMKEQPLTPTHGGSHAPARQLLQAPITLKELLSDEKDINILGNLKETSRTWAIGALEYSPIDRFLSSLDIPRWDVEHFAKILIKRSTSGAWRDDEFFEWLGSKSSEWHQRLYALLYREFEPDNAFYRLKNLSIVRLSTGKYGVGRECYFPTEDTLEDLILPRADVETYTSGKSRKDQEKARKFLESIGVREVGEKEQMEWVPQDDLFVRPAEASQDLLPEGFAFDPGWPWIKAVRFGEEASRKIEERLMQQEAGEKLGIGNEELDDARWFAGLSKEERQRLKSEHENKPMTNLPDRESSDPKRRTNKVREEVENAPERITEKKPRSVSIGREAVKEDSKQYLRAQYTNDDGIMICQVCKKPLPFKLADGSYYFETVEFLSELKQRHYQNYLTLCPNHAAMYQHVNDVADLIQKLFLAMAENEMKVVLAGECTTIYFTQMHIADLRDVIAVENSR